MAIHKDAAPAVSGKQYTRKAESLQFKRCADHTSSGHCGMLLYKGKEAVHVICYGKSFGFYGRHPFVHPAKDIGLDYVARLNTYPTPVEKRESSGWGKE